MNKKKSNPALNVPEHVPDEIYVVIKRQGYPNVQTTFQVLTGYGAQQQAAAYTEHDRGAVVGIYKLAGIADIEHHRPTVKIRRTKAGEA
jgi:hypothetical protein